MQIASSWECSDCPAADATPPASEQHDRQSTSSTAPRTLLIPTESLLQGDLAGYLACLDRLDTINPLLLATYRRAGQSCRNATDRKASNESLGDA
jgi:hypothetical protein